MQLLQRYKSLFSLSDYDVGLIPGIEHAIDTGDAPPFRQKLRRHPPAHEKIIQDQIQQLYHQGIIEPSMSPYASNVVLSQKRDGTWRLCIDHCPIKSTASARYLSRCKSR